jgi:hypothetical protein
MQVPIPAAPDPVTIEIERAESSLRTFRTTLARRLFDRAGFDISAIEDVVVPFRRLQLRHASKRFSSAYSKRCSVGFHLDSIPERSGNAVGNRSANLPSIRLLQISEISQVAGSVT